MDYKIDNDNELLFMISENNEDAEKILFEKYSYVAGAVAKQFVSIAKNYGLDYNDLYQEGLVGLMNAIKTYKNEKNVTFYTYACKCIEYKIKDTIRKSNRKKHSTLNSALSLDAYNDEEETALYNLISSDDEDPSVKLIGLEEEKIIVDNLKEVLSSTEKSILNLKINGYTNSEIETILKKDKKYIENALTRIKQKYKKIKK